MESETDAVIVEFLNYYMHCWLRDLDIDLEENCLDNKGLADPIEINFCLFSSTNSY